MENRKDRQDEIKKPFLYCISFSPFMYKMSFRFWSFLKRGSRNDEAGNYNKLVCDYIQRKAGQKKKLKTFN